MCAALKSSTFVTASGCTSRKLLSLSIGELWHATGRGLRTGTPASEHENVDLIPTMPWNQI